MCMATMSTIWNAADCTVILQGTNAVIGLCCATALTYMCRSVVFYSSRSSCALLQLCSIGPCTVKVSLCCSLGLQPALVKLLCKYSCYETLLQSFSSPAVMAHASNTAVLPLSKSQHQHHRHRPSRVSGLILLHDYNKPSQHTKEQLNGSY